MTQQLTDYTQVQSLQKNLTTGAQVASDSRVPYSYSEWYRRNTGIIPEQARSQYEKYILEWYRNRASMQSDASNRLKSDYIALARQIGAVFGTTVDASWLTDVDFADDLDVQNAIPLYAKKLKELAIYLVNKREAVKRAKLKYNLAGTEQALERVFYEYLLKAFTRRKFPGNEYITAAPALSTLLQLPELSAVAGVFQIRVDEVYDDTAYFDKDPRQAITTYFNTSAATVTAFFDQLSIPEETLDFIYSTGITPLCADNPLFWSFDSVMSQYSCGVPLSALQSVDSTILVEYTKMGMAEKYIGTKQFWLSGGFYAPWQADASYELKQGNNWVYWVSGEQLYNGEGSIYVDPIALNDTSLIDSGATGGTTYDSSDVVFFRRNNSIDGAWLQSSAQSTSAQTMSALLNHGRYEFRFPFPGYGVSGSGIEWTGAKFENVSPDFVFLTRDEQIVVRDEYWRSAPQISVDPIPLNDTNLIQSGALPGKQYNTADCITVQVLSSDSVRDEVLHGSQQHAFCYRMDNTDLPIAAGVTRRIIWPIQIYDDHPTITVPVNQSTAVSLTSINVSRDMVGAVAGASINDGDVITKYSGECETVTQGIAWLSGARIAINGLIAGAYGTAASQPGVSFVINGGDTATFVWQEYDTPASEVFKGYIHQQDCQYLRDPFTSLYSDVDKTKWKNCTCRSIAYSPLGHTGVYYDDIGRLCDVLVAVYNPFEPFNIDTWRDSAGASYRTSSEFGWFRLSGSQIENDAGWGHGEWVTNTGQPFILQHNRMYRFIRHSLAQCNISDAPYFVIRYPFSNFIGEWVDADSVNDQLRSLDRAAGMKLYPNDKISYTHRPTNKIYVERPVVDIATVEVRTPVDFNAPRMITTHTRINPLAQQINTLVTPMIASCGEEPTTTTTQEPEHPAPCPCPCSGDWPPLEWPCSGLAQTYILDYYYSNDMRLKSGDLPGSPLSVYREWRVDDPVTLTAHTFNRCWWVASLVKFTGREYDHNIGAWGPWVIFEGLLTIYLGGAPTNCRWIIVPDFGSPAAPGNKYTGLTPAGSFNGVSQSTVDGNLVARQEMWCTIVNGPTILYAPPRLLSEVNNGISVTRTMPRISLIDCDGAPINLPTIQTSYTEAPANMLSGVVVLS